MTKPTTDALISELFKENQALQKIIQSKILNAWKQLILSLSIPIAAGSLDLIQVKFLNGRFIMLGASVIGTAILAYSFWLYREVAAMQKYSRELERQINELIAPQTIGWEFIHNPYARKPAAVPIIFLTFVISMAVVCGLSLLHAVTDILEAPGEPLPIWIALLTCIPIILLFGAITNLIYAIYISDVSEKE